MSSPFVLANSQNKYNQLKPAKNQVKDLHPQPKNSYLDRIKLYPIFEFLKMSHYGFRPKKIKPGRLA
jgi:hypothetical protein